MNNQNFALRQRTGVFLFMQSIAIIIMILGRNVAGNILKLHANENLLDFKVKKLILAGNRTRQGYARKRTLKLAGHFFMGHA